MIRADQEIAVTLTAADWQVVLGGVAELPYRVSAQVIAKLEAQMRAAAPDAFVPPEGVPADEPLPNGHASA